MLTIALSETLALRDLDTSAGLESDFASAISLIRPFSLFNGALVPSEILRSPELTPSEKLVFARLMQFAGGEDELGRPPSGVAQEVALSVTQARRCIAALENKGLIRRVARSGRSNEFEFLWHACYEPQPQSPTAIVYERRGAITGDRTGAIIRDRQKRIN